MTKDRQRQLDNQLAYFEKWLDDEFKQTKYKTTKKFKEAMVMAYLRGRGDRA